MVDRVKPKDLFVFKLLTDNFKQGTYQFKLRFFKYSRYDREYKGGNEI